MDIVSTYDDYQQQINTMRLYSHSPSLAKSFPKSIFKNEDVLMAVISTSPTPVYKVTGLTKSKQVVTVNIEETNWHSQLQMQTYKGFLLGIKKGIVTNKGSIKISIKEK